MSLYSKVKGGDNMNSTTINKIRGYRNMLNLSQENLGKYLGITKQAYSNKETGKAKFNDKEKVKLLELFKKVDDSLTIDSLFF